MSGSWVRACTRRWDYRPDDAHVSAGVTREFLSAPKIITKVINQKPFARSCVYSEEFGELNTAASHSAICVSLK